MNPEFKEKEKTQAVRICPTCTPRPPYKKFRLGEITCSDCNNPTYNRDYYGRTRTKLSIGKASKFRKLPSKT